MSLPWAASITLVVVASSGGNGDGDNSSSGDSNARGCIASMGWCDDGV